MGRPMLLQRASGQGVSERRGQQCDLTGGLPTASSASDALLHQRWVARTARGDVTHSTVTLGRRSTRTLARGTTDQATPGRSGYTGAPAGAGVTQAAARAVCSVACVERGRKAILGRGAGLSPTGRHGLHKQRRNFEGYRFRWLPQRPRWPSSQCCWLGPPCRSAESDPSTARS